jgi:hypothetical protein
VSLEELSFKESMKSTFLCSHHYLTKSYHSLSLASLYGGMKGSVTARQNTWIYIQRKREIRRCEDLAPWITTGGQIHCPIIRYPEMY